MLTESPNSACTDNDGDPFGKAWLFGKGKLKRAMECVAKVSEALGNDVHLLIEGHGRFDIPALLKIGYRLEEFAIPTTREDCTKSRSACGSPLQQKNVSATAMNTGDFSITITAKQIGAAEKNYFAQNNLLFLFQEIKVMWKGKTQMARKREKISIAAIASEIGVSAATVSRAINQRNGVSEENRRRILRKLREYDFHPHYPPRNKSRIAVVYSSTLFSHYDSEVLSGIFHSMRGNNLSPNVILYQNTGKSSLLEQLRDQQSSGALLVVPSRFREELPELAASGLPVMLLDESCTEPGIGFIDNDSYSGSLAAAQHLLSLGHRHIVYFARSLNAQNHRRRCRAYEDAMRAAGLPARILPVPGIGAEEDLRFVSESLRLYPQTTAAMTTNDDLALLVLKAVSGLGLRIPDDFSVAGFDDYAMSAYLNPSLTTVRHPCREIADTAVKAMSRYLQSNGKIPLPRITLPTELIIRSSTGPLQNHGKEKRTK